MSLHPRLANSTTSDILGAVAIDPPLNTAEVDYLTGFAQSRRWHRDAGPYHVPQHPILEPPPVGAGQGARFNEPYPGQPGLWCDWVPACRGQCLTYDGHEKFSEPTRWLRYLIDHFLAPDALAKRSGEEVFEEFGFDHRLNGAFAARSRETGRLWLIKVKDNVVREQTIVPGDELPPGSVLPYEDELDAIAQGRRRRRTSQRVIPSEGMVLRA